MQNFPDKDSLSKYLQNELGYCNCASSAVWTVLRKTLQIALERSSAGNDNHLFRQKTTELEDLLQLDSELGLGEWFVYFLEGKGLISHNSNSSDCWITAQGRQLLKAMDEFEKIFFEDYR